MSTQIQPYRSHNPQHPRTDERTLGKDEPRNQPSNLRKPSSEPWIRRFLDNPRSIDPRESVSRHLENIWNTPPQEYPIGESYEYMSNTLEKNNESYRGWKDKALTWVSEDYANPALDWLIDKVDDVSDWDEGSNAINYIEHRLEDGTRYFCYNLNRALDFVHPGLADRCWKIDDPDDDENDDDDNENEPPDGPEPPRDPPNGPPVDFDTCPPFTADYYFDEHGYQEVPYGAFLLIREQSLITTGERWIVESIYDDVREEVITHFRPDGVSTETSTPTIDTDDVIDSNESWVPFDPCKGDKITCFREIDVHPLGGSTTRYGFQVSYPNGSESTKFVTWSKFENSYTENSYLRPYKNGFELLGGYTFNSDFSRFRWQTKQVNYKLFAIQPHRIQCPTLSPPIPPPDCDCMSCCGENKELLQKILKRIGDEHFPLNHVSPIEEIDGIESESIAESLEWNHRYRTWIDTNRLGVNDLPAELPTTMLDDGDARTKLKTYPELMVHIYKYLDEMFGEFPLKIRLKSGGDAVQIIEDIELKNIGETLAELFQIAYQDVVTTNEMQRTGLRTASELISVKAAQARHFDVSFAIMQSLGFDFFVKERKMNSAFNPKKDAELETFLQLGEIEVDGYEARDSENLWALIMKMAKSVEIIKQVFYKTGDIEDLAPEIFQEFIGLRNQNKETDKEAWLEFIENIENPAPGYQTSTRKRKVDDLERTDD